VRAPEDFVVRAVRLAKMLPDPTEPGVVLLEELTHEPNQIVQGHDSEMAHVNCVRRTDRNPLLLEVWLGVRAGLTTFWLLGVAMTAVLLRVFEHDLKPATTGSGHLEVAAAVLLFGPALAAAWAVRSDEGDLLRNVLSGTRQLLMGSAILSVAAALALIGYAPFGWEPVTAIECYAALAYAIAVIVAIGWSITRKSPWIAYRYVLNSPGRNLWASALLAAVAAAIAAHTGLSEIAVGVGLLGLGLGLAVISANRVGTDMGEGGRPFAPVAGVGAAIALISAGAYLDFYGNVLSTGILAPVTCGGEAAVFVLAIASLLRVDHSYSSKELSNMGGSVEGL